jgi:hypothetical protein
VDEHPYTRIPPALANSPLAEGSSSVEPFGPLTLRCPCFAAVQPSHPCLGVRRHAAHPCPRSTPASQPRGADRYSSAPAFAAAQPPLPSGVVRAVRRDIVSRRKVIRPHPPGSRSRPPFDPLRLPVAMLLDSRLPGHTSLETSASQRVSASRLPASTLQRPGHSAAPLRRLHETSR